MNDVDTPFDWWRDELADAPPLHEIRTDDARSSEAVARPETVTFDWSDSVGPALNEFASERDASVSGLLTAGFAGLVHRYTGQNTVVLGLLGEPEATAIVPLRFEFSQATTFDELLDQYRDRRDAAARHHVPFERLVGELGEDAESSYVPVVQLAAGSASEIEVDPVEVVGTEAMFDLTVVCDEASREVGGEVSYNASLFESASIERLVGHLRNLLTQATRTPEVPLGEHALPTNEERRVILQEWNDTDVPVDLDRCFHEIFEEQVDRTPESLAVVEPGGGDLTYRQLDRRANKVARHLLELGVEPEDLVTICVDRSLDLVVGIMGILKAGAAYLPINPTYPKDRIDFILDETEPPVAVTQSHLEEIFAAADSELVCLDSDESTIESYSDARPESDVEPGNLAYVVYTSGSTGRPKGVMNEHRNVANLAEVLPPAFGIEADDRVSQFVSETFDATIWEFAMTFDAGATLVLLPSGRPPLGLELGQHLRDDGITLACLPPAVVPDIPQEMAEGVETMVVAGEACPAKVVENWAPGRRFINGYGPREATAYATTADCEPTGEPPPIGRPLGNYKCYVLDENEQLLPVGVDGELYIGGPGVGRGYLERPDLNAEKFVPDPFSDDPDARMYRTGDVVRWRTDGQLAFVGRRDFQVQLRGFRVELGAIEEELREHEAVSDAVATKHDPDHGPQQIVGYVVAQSGVEESRLPDKLTAFLEESLPEYMVPGHIMVLDEFPLNTTGKIDRHALPAPATDRPSSDRELAEPETESEKMLAEEWAELLGFERIGVDENFFDLGGTSLMIARLALRIKDRFGVEVPVETMYETPTVRAIAGRIDEAEGSEDDTSQLCFDPTLEIDEEARLAADITAEGPRVDPGETLEDVLLTGATGFVGTHLLAELLEQTSARIHCLVRADDPEHLKRRLEDAFETFEIDTRLPDDRVEPVVGDLAAEGLGLDEAKRRELAANVDAVYHNGAKVDQVRSYRDMKPANVTGTERMLRFACEERVTPFHYVSTLGSVHHPDYAERGSVPENAPAGPLGELPNGYMQTKCVGEHMVREAMERGMPASIYRLGAVSGHTETGVMEPADFTYSILRTAIDLGLAPDLDWDLMITPVDFVAGSIATLSRWPDGRGKTFHVTHPEPNYLSEVVELLRDTGYDIEFARYDAFLDRLSEETRTGGETPLLRFLPYLSQRFPGESKYKAQSYYTPVDWDCENLTGGLAAMDAPTSPPSIEELISFYLAELADRGFIESGEW